MWIRAAFVLWLVVLGACGDDQPTEFETADKLMGQWVSGWNADDPDAVARVFTPEARYADNNVSLTGREEIRAHVVVYRDVIVEVWHEAGADNGDGTFTFPTGFDYQWSEWNTGTDIGEVVVRIDEELITDMHFTWRAAG